MADLVVVVVLIVFFMVGALYVRGCDRLIEDDAKDRR